jgi:hypothetical protein
MSGCADCFAWECGSGAIVSARATNRQRAPQRMVGASNVKRNRRRVLLTTRPRRRGHELAAADYWLSTRPAPSPRVMAPSPTHSLAANPAGTRSGRSREFTQATPEQVSLERLTKRVFVRSAAKTSSSSPPRSLTHRTKQQV